MGLFGELFGRKNGPEAAAFSMKVDFVFSIAPGKTSVSGQVTSGAIGEGDLVYFTTARGEKKSCRSILPPAELDTEPKEQLPPGVVITGLLLPVEADEVPVGTMIFGSPQ
jgi:translation elongation factor EF-1alpha